MAESILMFVAMRPQGASSIKILPVGSGYSRKQQEQQGQAIASALLVCLTDAALEGLRKRLSDESVEG